MGWGGWAEQREAWGGGEVKESRRGSCWEAFMGSRVAEWVEMKQVQASCHQILGWRFPVSCFPTVMHAAVRKLTWNGTIFFPFCLRVFTVHPPGNYGHVLEMWSESQTMWPMYFKLVTICSQCVSVAFLFYVTHKVLLLLPFLARTILKNTSQWGVPGEIHKWSSWC